MKVLSLLQPWATLYVRGHKLIETRSWATKHRGPLLVHASANKKGIGKAMAQEVKSILKHMPHVPGKTIRDKYDDEWPLLDWNALPFGAIIGMVNIDHVIAFDDHFDKITGKLPKSIDIEGKEWRLTYEEEMFGDYSPGRYGWLSSGAKEFTNPIPAKGKLLLWDYEIEDDVLNDMKP